MSTTINAADVNKLRQMTGAGMMDCKKALAESNGDFEAAIDFLRKKGQKISANRADRKASEGAVIALTNAERTKGVVIELNCETDFVAKNEDFVKTARSVAEAVLEQEPESLEAVQSMSINGVALSQRLLDEMAKIGEKLEVSKYSILKGNNIVAYIHAGNRLGVLVQMNNAPSEANLQAGRDVAMQIAAMNPVAVDRDGVDASTIEREMEIGREQARAEGKPEAMIDKIAEGKLQKFFKESTLLQQEFVKDPSKTVAKMLADVEPGLTVTHFVRVALG
ncbi:MAG: elongation factor Ts [Bacteroidetes bacterium]|nr:elongation factor Ts [Bacteroidota bacterium]